MQTKNTILAQLVEDLINVAIVRELITRRDKIYLRNKLYFLLGIPSDYYQFEASTPNTDIATILEQIYLQLDESQREKIASTRDQIQTQIIDAILPAPSSIENKFYALVNSMGITQALQWYYQFSKDTDYIKVAAIAKNKYWLADCKYGQLEITINLSKPEKDPKEIAKAKLQVANNYPKCLLCIENEGYSGNYNHPARQNHRMIKLNLANADYYFQYSPYLYYNEHSIVINPEHQDMLVNKAMFQRFYAFVDLMPHYLIGSNTDIPIVGGSILTHDHFQAGHHVFPVEKALVRHEYQSTKFSNVQIAHLHWPISTIRLIGNQAETLELSLKILELWYQYRNAELNIEPVGNNNERQNAITPIMRKLGDNQYEVYLMLRNNATSVEHPDGIFHPHANLHHIKKENIGLIEAMGLAILPGRLATELQQIKQLILNEIVSGDESLLKHHDWIEFIKSSYSSLNSENIDLILQKEVASKFSQVLEDAGVFKDDANGNAALRQFIAQIDE